MRLSLIVAMNAQRVIGREGDLPWRLSADLQRFKRLTMGHCLIMGRTTYESIGRPLPGRTSLVLSRDSELSYPHAAVHVMPNLAAARDLAVAEGESEAFVIGGGQIYDMALAEVDRIYLTLVDADCQGDTYFPQWDRSKWRVLDEEIVPADEKNQFTSLFQVLERQ